MEKKTALGILKTHNRWRRGEDSEPQLNPSDIGKSIDVAIEVMEDENKQAETKQCDIHVVSPSAYLVDLMGKHLVVLADSIADACDKLDAEGYENYEFVRSTSIDVLH